MDYINIPDELKKLNRWVCWKIEERDGSPTKVPINPKTGGRAMSNNADTWSSFDAALGFMQKNNLPGIGFMFNGDGIVGVDIDNCRDKETGQLSDAAKDIISTLGSYTETSQSGKGIHIICRGKLPAGKRRKGPVEMYETGRYFIMTGQLLDDGHAEIEERTEALKAVHTKYVADKPKKSKKSAAANVEINLDDDEIIQKAMNAKNGSLFQSLMNGTWETLYASQSEADLALTNILSFYTKDPAVIDRIFRRSGLYREKWDEKRPEGTYGDVTIGKSLRDVTQTYAPRKQRKAAHGQEPPEMDLGYDQLYGEPVDGPNENNSEIQDTTSDLGRSKIFSHKYKDVLRWCGEMRSWLVWNGKYWEHDRTLQVIQMAKETVDPMIYEAGQAVSKATGEDEIKKAKQIFRDTIKAKSERSIKAMVELAKSDLPITVQQLDQDPYLLNCLNGVVDLRTGALLPHKQDYYMTKIAGASYEPGKNFKKFGQFLNDITCGDSELAHYFQQICGMAAVGKIFYEGMCIFYGSGRNGKSTFLNLISRVFGDYACSINPEVLMSQKDGRQITGGVSVEGKRFVTAMEMEEGRRLSSAMLKKLASADPITERPLYQNERTFLPSHTLVMATNFLPKVSSTDAGTWRRIAVVPFKATFEGTKEIKDYASVLYSEDADAILVWIVEGARKYIANGHNIMQPKVVQEATSQYRNAEDWLNNFISECCEVGEYEESGGRLFEAYKEWCVQNNESYIRRSRDFALQLELQGFEKRRTMRGSVWEGLRLLSSAQTSSFSKYRSERNMQSSILDDDELDEYTRKHM